MSYTVLNVLIYLQTKFSFKISKLASISGFNYGTGQVSVLNSIMVDFCK